MIMPLDDSLQRNTQVGGLCYEPTYSTRALKPVGEAKDAASWGQQDPMEKRGSLSLLWVSDLLIMKDRR